MITMDCQGNPSGPWRKSTILTVWKELQLQSVFRFFTVDEWALSFLLNKPASAIPCCRWTSLTQSAYSWFEIYQHLPIFNKLLGSWWTINIFLSSDLHVLWTNQSTVRTIGGGGNNLLHPCSHPSPTTIATPSCSPHTLPTRTWTKSQKQRTNKITTHTFGDSEHE